MIANKKNFLFNRITHYYVKRLVRRHFCELLFNDISIDQNRSVLLIGNHFSFWDGVILYCVNDMLIRKKYHVMLLEETSRKMPILKYSGAFSVNKGSRDVLKAIDYAAALLDDPGNLVLIFPQGRLFPNFIDDITFEKGVMRIIDRAAGKFQLVFASTFIQYYKHIKPTITVYLKSATESYAGKSINDLQEAYRQQHYAARKLQTETEFDIQ